MGSSDSGIRHVPSTACAASFLFRAAPADRLHITLVLLEDFANAPPGIVNRLCEIGDRVAAAPFEMMLDRVTGSARSIALRPRSRNAAQDALRGQVTADLVATGLAERAGYRFNPHVTLGYRAGAAFNRPTAAISWTADTIELIHSHVGRTRHDVLGRWPFRDGDDAQLSLSDRPTGLRLAWSRRADRTGA